ncbi:MAG: hypothetical protein GF311_27470 [Candidatus Lokiarchaeota archaeon]|nr:hypothetical protein [Candidatus Lokiarchaeota archaeon]
MNKKHLISYSFASIGLNALTIFVMTKFLHFYDDKIHTPIVPMFWAMAALFAGRCVDALTDPLAGYLSDRTRSRWGRRKPFLALSMPVMLLSFVLIWFPPFGRSGGFWPNFIYLFVVVNLFFTSFTLFAIPYDAHIAELSKTKGERLTASRYKSVFAVIGIVLASIFLGSGELRTTSIAVAGIAGFSFLVSIAGIRERHTHAREPLRLIPAFRTTFSDTGFLKLCLLILCIESAGNIFIKDIEYFTDHILIRAQPTADRTLSISGLYLSFIVAMVAGLPFWQYLAARSTKLRALKHCLCYLIVLFPLYYLVGYIPGLSPVMTAWVYYALVGFGYGAVNLLIIAILADVTDHDTRTGGLRREAMYFGVYAFIRKMGFAAGVFIFSTAIGVFEYFDRLTLGFRLIGPLIAVIALFGYFFLKTISIDEG